MLALHTDGPGGRTWRLHVLEDGLAGHGDAEDGFVLCPPRMISPVPNSRRIMLDGSRARP